MVHIHNSLAVLTLESKPFSSAFSISGFFHSNRFGGSLFLVSLSQLPLSA